MITKLCKKYFGMCTSNYIMASVLTVLVHEVSRAWETIWRFMCSMYLEAISCILKVLKSGNPCFLFLTLARSEWFMLWTTTSEKLTYLQHELNIATKHGLSYFRDKFFCKCFIYILYDNQNLSLQNILLLTITYVNTYI